MQGPAIYRQIAGAYYGVEGIPLEWRAKRELEGLAEGLVGARAT